MQSPQAGAVSSSQDGCSWVRKDLGWNGSPQNTGLNPWKERGGSRRVLR